MQPHRALRLLGACVLVVAQQFASASLASADSPCVNGLPIDHTYANGHWHTGGYQDHGTPIQGVRANIRTYNPFAADTPTYSRNRCSPMLTPLFGTTHDENNRSASTNGTAMKITPGTSVATVTGIHTCCARRSIVSST